MSLIKDMSLKVKLPIIFMGLTALAMGVSGYFNITNAFSAGRQASEVQLTSTRDARAQQIDDLIARIDSDIRAFAASAEAQQAMRGLERSWSNMSAEQRADIRALYGDNNPHPEGARALLVDADDRSEFSMTHAMSHSQMVGFMESLNYGDLLLINPEGDIVYTVQKRGDFGVNLNDPAMTGTPLADVFEALSAQTGEPEPIFVDVEPYAPNADVPTAFLAQRLVNVRGDTRGLIVLELPFASIQEVIDRPAGLGETGEAYLLGPDRIFRSAPRLNTLDQPYFETQATGVHVEAALAQGIGVAEGAGTWYSHAMLAYAPIEVWGHSWALVVEKSMDEVRAPAIATRNRSLMEMALVQVAIFFMGWFVARSLTGPLGRVVHALRKTASGDLGDVIADADRKDEIGQIASALQDLQGELKDGQSAALDAQYKGAAFDQSSAAMMIMDVNRIITYVNPALSALFVEHVDVWAKRVVFDPKDLVGMCLDTLHPSSNLEKRFESTSTVTSQITLDEIRLSLTFGRIVTPETDVHTGYIVEWKDITASQRSATILNAIEASQAVFEMTAQGRVVGANANMMQITGVASFEALFETLTAHGHGAGADVIPMVDAIQTAQGGSTVSGTFLCTKASGDALWFAGSLNPVLEDDGRVSRVVAILDDVSAQRATQERAAQDREEMQRVQNQVVVQLGIGLNALAEGDLHASIEEPFHPDYEQLRSDFNSTSSRLRGAMREVRANAESIRGEVADISNAAADLSSRTETQAATLEQTAAAIEELTASVQSAAEGATAANNVVRNARDNAEESGLVVTKAVSAMGEISASSTKISKIIGVIDDIAFQTNLLALNAGVEAARAGDAGRGFAVVASEVRALAQRSSEAAKEINGLISESSKHVSHGVDLVGKAGAALQEIVGFVTNISDHVSAIEVSAREQSSGLSEINTSMAQLDQVTQQNAAMFEETTAASQSLNNEADTLLALIKHFRIDLEDELPSGEFRGAVAADDGRSSKERVASSGERKGQAPAPSFCDGTSAVDIDFDTKLDDWQEF